MEISEVGPEVTRIVVHMLNAVEYVDSSKMIQETYGTEEELGSIRNKTNVRSITSNRIQEVSQKKIKI